MAMIFIVLSLISLRGCLPTKKVWDSTVVAKFSVSVPVSPSVKFNSTIQKTDVTVKLYDGGVLISF